MRRRTTAFISAGVALTALLGAAVAGPASAVGEEGGTARIGVEYFPEPGGEGRRTEVPLTTPDHGSRARGSAATGAGAAIDGDVGRLKVTGPVEDRLDVVIIGDGYTADEQDAFHEDAAEKWGDIGSVEPYGSYQGLMNVWTVDAVSAESGVSGDPSADVLRDTALGSYYWCGETERLVCTDIDKAAAYAAKAPAADLVVVLVNSTKYGGAGYSGLEAYDHPFDGLSTISSDHADSGLIAVHELAHSVGLLADEYTYPSYGTWPGGENGWSNASILTAERMAAGRTKWYRWLGEEDPTGGAVGTFEGSDYYPYGVHRPTANSLMRALNTDEFNLPGREALIAGFYREANGLSSRTGTDRPVGRTTRLTVEQAELTGLARPELRWYVDGVEVRRAEGRTSVNAASLGVRPDGRTHTVTVRSVDATSSVRDPSVLAEATESLTWTVAAARPRS